MQVSLNEYTERIDSLIIYTYIQWEFSFFGYVLVNVYVIHWDIFICNLV